MPAIQGSGGISEVAHAAIDHAEVSGIYVPYFSRRLLATVDNVAVTLNVNSTSYTSLVTSSFCHDWDAFPATHFRLSLWGQANAGGQTISLQLTSAAVANDPISAVGDDLVVTNTAQLWDSGWIAVSDAMAGFDWLNTSVKGSAATTDLSLRFLDIAFKIEP